ncbi:MAG: hypothetical protein K0S45_949 [Nitrospira sp.]|nr:hypothetical protein [Nitrospira sp.]
MVITSNGQGNSQFITHRRAMEQEGAPGGRLTASEGVHCAAAMAYGEIIDSAGGNALWT